MISAIFLKEIYSMLVSSTTYIVGFFFLFFFSSFFPLFEGDLIEFFDYFTIILWFLLPLLSTSLINSEKRKNTLELLLTAPISITQIILEKYLAIWIYFLMLLCLSFLNLLIMGAIIFNISIHWPFIWLGYLYLILFGSLVMAVGLFYSCFTNQTTAILFTYLSLFVFMFGSIVLKDSFPVSGYYTKMLENILLNLLAPFNLYTRMINFSAGILVLKDIVYFIILTLIFLKASIFTVSFSYIRK